MAGDALDADALDACKSTIVATDRMEVLIQSTTWSQFAGTATI
jgi:hypothetical protein